MRSYEKGTAGPTPVEDTGWAHSLACRLIGHAARSAPPSLSERLEEEWLADLADQPGQFAGLRFAIGCCWATYIITREHCAVNRPVATSTTGSKTMTLEPHNDFSFFPQRTSALFLVVGLHVLLIYAFASGLASRVIELIPPAMQTVVLQESRPHDPPPVLPLPSRPRLQDIDPPVQPAIVVPPETSTCCEPPIVAPLSPPSPPAHRSVIRVQGGAGKGFPNTDDFYPPSAIRLGQQGIATVQVCVNDKGALTSEPTLAQSSGVASIDAGALRLARAGSGHYRPNTEDGLPVSSCYAVPIRFVLRN
jgi:protein TonB